jgi:hypothetical protein
MPLPGCPQGSSSRDQAGSGRAVNAGPNRASKAVTPCLASRSVLCRVTA